MSYEAQVIADSSGQFVGNGLRFETEKEAEVYAADLMSRWMAVRQTRIVLSLDPVNYKLTDIGFGRFRMEPVEEVKIVSVQKDPLPGTDAEPRG